MNNPLWGRNVALLLVFAFSMVGLLGYAWHLSAASNDTDAPAYQITFFPITLVLPTATRTPTPINVGNFVWDDIDHDGRQDAGEPGMAGVTVQLWNSAKNDLIASTTTNSNGNYTLIAPVPGNYRVRVLLPNASLDQFSPKDAAGGDDQLDSDINPTGTNFGFTDTYVFASNLISITSIDAGIIKFRTPTPTRTPTPINVGNFVWDDFNGDGHQDPGEPGLAGVTVQLWNAAKNDLIASTTTNANGNYTVIAPVPGNYRVRVLLPNPAMDAFTLKDQGDDQLDSDINASGTDFGFTDTYVFASNLISITSIDAGIIKFHTPTPTRTPTPINVGNFVWDDVNSNGQQDAGEPGMGGVTVELWNASKSNLIDTDVTDGNGHYTVTAPVPGSYRVRVILPNAMDAFSPKNQAGGDDALDSDINNSGTNFGYTDVISLGAAVISTPLWDAGIRRYLTPTPSSTPATVNVGNYVWNDIDRDGKQDSTELGIAGVTVELWNTAKTVMYSSGVTNASGIYKVVAPTPGNYRVRVILSNASWSFSPKDQAAGNDNLDSDINRSGANLGYTDIVSVTANTGNIDAGILIPMAALIAPDMLIDEDATPTPAPTTTPTPPASPTITPTPTFTLVTGICGGFRLTSPLDGLPNGVATFFFDPVRGEGITYQIVIMDEARRLLGIYFVPQGATSVNGDVSTAVIGGSFQLLVQVTALDATGQTICTDEHLILRATLDGAPLPNAVATPTPVGSR